MYACKQNTITVFDYSRNKFKLNLLRCDDTRENNFKVFERKRKVLKERNETVQTVCTSLYNWFVN